jgi:hypothetical protein
MGVILKYEAALGPVVRSASNRNEYQKQKKKSFWSVERGQRVRLRTSPPSMTPLCRQCGIPSFSQPYRPSLHVTGIALLLMYMYCWCTLCWCYYKIFSYFVLANVVLVKDGHVELVLCARVVVFAMRGAAI